MEVYAVYERGTCIGTLTVRGGMHRYEPIAEAVRQVEARAVLLRVMREGTDGFVEPIPFFTSRIGCMKRAGLRGINDQTDCFLLALEEDPV